MCCSIRILSLIAVLIGSVIFGVLAGLFMGLNPVGSNNFIIGLVFLCITGVAFLVAVIGIIYVILS